MLGIKPRKNLFGGLRKNNNAHIATIDSNSINCFLSVIKYFLLLLLLVTGRLTHSLKCKKEGVPTKKTSSTTTKSKSIFLDFASN